MCDAKYASKGGLEAYRQHLAERKEALAEEKMEKDMGKAERAAALVQLLDGANGVRNPACAALRSCVLGAPLTRASFAQCRRRSARSCWRRSVR